MSATVQDLSKSEWAAVAIALKDAERCGCAAEQADAPRGPLRRLAGFLFGTRRANPLADPRLEAVRSFVCASYRRRGPAEDLAQPLFGLGFSQAQVAALGLLAR